jgi:segregation and condensation protein A
MERMNDKAPDRSASEGLDRAEAEFEAAGGERAEGEADFRVDVDGYEGPLDLLLELARRQKVDLSRISVLALAEQYLEFIEAARRVRLELAADYLVMAAWLAYLKSRLLLPAPPKAEEPDPRELAASLARRLDIINAPLYRASLFDLLSAYAIQRQKQALSHVSFKTRQVWSLAEAREALERIVGMAVEWTTLDDYLIAWVATPAQARTVRASTFSASLEMVKEGLIDLRQDRAFAPLWLRRRQALAAE